MSGARILVVDDDPAILRLVRGALAKQGYRVDAAASLAEARRAFAEQRPDVIVLDLVLPDGDGSDFCAEVRRSQATPILVLSAIGDDARKVRALDEGADDYLTKPFSLAELEARIRVALRRAAGQAKGQALVAGPISIDLGRRAVSVSGRALHLTPREFELLRELATNRGRTLTQRHLLTRVWGAEYVDDAHILRTFIYQLRTRLAEAGPAGRGLIVNDAGVGYRLEVPPEDSPHPG